MVIIDMEAKRPQTLEQERLFREAFLSHLCERLAAPTAQWPTARCWTKNSFDKICRQITDGLNDEEIRACITHRELLDWLERLSLACSIAVEGQTFYLVEIGAAVGAEIDPLELLMAEQPDGVVCYFSALAFHSLTTQVAAHHQVAVLQKPSAGAVDKLVKHDRDLPSESTKPSVARTPSLGKLLFHYRGTPFYRIRRSARLVPGVQLRNYGPRTQIRITTREQALLDTLYHPVYCGGTAVAFEAWETALGTGGLDEDRLLEYLQAMKYPATARRLGALLQHLGYQPGMDLRNQLERCRTSIDRLSPHATISLFPGHEYSRTNEDWLVNMP